MQGNVQKNQTPPTTSFLQKTIGGGGDQTSHPAQGEKAELWEEPGSLHPPRLPAGNYRRGRRQDQSLLHKERESRAAGGGSSRLHPLQASCRKLQEGRREGAGETFKNCATPNLCTLIGTENSSELALVLLPPGGVSTESVFRIIRCLCLN
ncbi:hypothetical protein AB205_0112610 [Aquarana catesbeiana]|uniref:Uncharacterized protein n=1 Tax=Aquarana catesbeiana TaxID=8400 RepID=A0A2G9RHR1_AQUCT|nr:hypothetical protein AB205_0112610 [Aquarana catesbeiana]